MWNELLIALALMLVIEGVLPFLSPDTFRRTLVTLVRLDDRGLRLTGLVSMLIGLALLYWIH
ncbi:DUF2065 domain-containing protein [Thiohalobacter thiocyanaticus]|uniref:DUF2065 domain-containing protein n=1 Tax=Thiohalobacter thiocyanaticus TaxID=585455 RepID=A0A426QLL9_9GAMM|nr:DUF2065 domain-containing protein [Thiohalobacter thiocyanaticus]RRQ22661.1 DUF2065 domain-containing protein [Thiohalobacter thiocyanaticus]